MKRSDKVRQPWSQYDEDVVLVKYGKLKSKNRPGFWIAFAAWIVIVLFFTVMAALFILALATAIELIGLVQ